MREPTKVVFFDALKIWVAHHRIKRENWRGATFAPVGDEYVKKVFEVAAGL